MDDASIAEIVTEIQPLIVNRAPGKIFQFNASAFAIDFGLRDRGFLFISVEPAEPRLYLIKRRVRDLEKASSPLSAFALGLRKELGDTKVTSVEKESADRIVQFHFDGRDELGHSKHRTLTAQLTGKSANLLLIGGDNKIIQAARRTKIPGQHLGEVYEKPTAQQAGTSHTQPSALLGQIQSGQFGTPSEAADAYFTSLFAEKELAAQRTAALADLRRKISQQEKLLDQLQRDLKSHSHADQQKRWGDLLLANLSTGRRQGDRVELIDYFVEGNPTVDLEMDESTTLQEEAARRFALYSRSKRAVARITMRVEATRNELIALQSEHERLQSEPLPIADGSASPIATPIREPSSSPRRATKRIPGTRRYVSSDGLEILVGRTARDNDHLTFKIANPNDLWLHAADYGGSHVVVRNSTRKAIPHRTLIEAAQLAGWFSQAKKDPKVDVHYTERKFVSKIKGAKPGLVRLQRFKTLTIQPKEAGTKD
jgi:predicted ribosome quality control (RQC) complex YloA/Tae2 family protein